jgi:uncharacterized damage-inducible protein DinB
MMVRFSNLEEIAMSHLARNAAALLLRELETLRAELEAYPDDRSIWAQPGLPNAAGTLALHLAGNIRYFIGATLGGSGYVRDRPREFAARDLPRAELFEEVSAAEAAVRAVLPSLSDSAIEAPFPEPVNGLTMITGDFLMHLCAHFAYHLGQLDYHRRVVTGQTNGLGALPLTGLRTAKPAEG